MATYVNDLSLKEIATGDEAGTWGTSTNTNLELIAEAFSFGTEAITTNANTHTTTIADGSTDPGRSIFLKYTGALDSDCTITIGPNTVSKLWLIENATTDSGSSGPYNIIIKQGTGATVTIPNSHTKAIYSDGAGSGGAMVEAFTDLNLTDTVTISGSTPTLTIGDAGEEDTKIVFDGNAQDFYIGLDDSADDLVIGKGTSVGTTPAIEIDENLDIKFAESIGVGQAASSTTGDIVAQTMSLKGTTPTLTIGDAGAEDTKIVFDGNAQDYYIGLDDSADDLLIGLGSSVGTTPAISIDENLKSVFGGTVDVNGNELILDADADTSITADTDDQIDIKIAGSDSYVITGGADPIFKMQGSGHPQLRLKTTGTTDNTSIDFGDSDSEVRGRVLYNHANDLMTFTVAGSTGAQITSAGKFLVNEIAHVTSGTLEIGNGDEKQLFDATEQTIEFQTADTERMRIGADGVAIGTTDTSDVRLRVDQNQNDDHTCFFKNTAAANATLGVEYNTGNSHNAANKFAFRYVDNGTLRFEARTDGGIANFQSNDSNLSDERLKTEIKDAPDCLDIINNLRVTTFKYKDQNINTKTNTGLIAQEVEKVDPSLIDLNGWNEESPEGEEPYKSLHTTDLMFKMLKSIQELSDKVERLENGN